MHAYKQFPHFRGVNIFAFFFFMAWVLCVIPSFCSYIKDIPVQFYVFASVRNRVLGGSFFTQCLLGLFYLIRGWSFCSLWLTVVMFKCIEQKVVLSIDNLILSGAYSTHSFPADS